MEVVDNNQVHETSEEESTGCDQDVFLNPQPSASTQVMPKMYILYRGAANGLDSQ